MSDGRRFKAGECRCAQKFAKPTICPVHGLRSKPVANPTQPRSR